MRVYIRGTTVLQDVTTGRNWVKVQQDPCIISYSCMLIYNYLERLIKKQKVLFVASFSAIRLLTFQKMLTSLQATHNYFEGPQRNPAEKSYQCRTQSPCKEKEEAPIDKWGNGKKLATVRIICVVYRPRSRALHCASVTRWRLNMLPSPAKSLLRRMGLLLKSKIAWAKNTCLGFGWGQVLLVQYLKPGKRSQFLKEMTLNLHEICLLGFSKPYQLKQGFQKIWEWYLSLRKMNSLAG